MQTQSSETRKPVIFSGIQPSGVLTLGNYIGALRNFKLLEDAYDCVYCVVDLHALTVRQEAAQLRSRCLSLAAIYMAVGLNPDKSLIYCQSHVSAHAELAWILNCYTYMGELQRMTQFKDKSAKHADNINAGLFTYPVLMAADILLYNAHFVPVGVDQKQHVELARNIAQRFNGAYSDTFAVPEPLIPQVGARVMSLSEPTAKMSKSDTNENSYVSMTDDPDTIMRKLKRAVTDSEGRVYRSAEKPGVSNLMSIYGVMTGKADAEIEAEFDGKGYGDFKAAVGESIVEVMRPIRAEYERYLADKAGLEAILADGAQKAQRLAQKTLAKVYRKVGI